MKNRSSAWLVFAVLVLSLLSAGCGNNSSDYESYSEDYYYDETPTEPEPQPENTEPQPKEETSTAPTPIALPISQPSQPKQEAPKVVSQPKSNCDPNYSGCVPIASDVDCSGGSGDGPAYVSGPITVIGSDIYGLDRDKDGIACQ